MILFYKIFLFLYKAGVQIAAFWNEKARLWRDGRKNICKKLEKEFVPGEEKVIWVHCASLGEFEQGKPVIEALKTKYPKLKFLVTFFSPSGYEIRKNYEGASVFYLPMDSPANAARFISIVKPDLALFIKYEFWYYYLSELKKRNIPVLLISGLFRKNQPFFKFYGSLHRKMLNCFTYFFVQNDTSKELLASININNAAVSGDTRFDRVIQLTDNFQPLELIEKFCGSSKVIVAGSTWPADEAELDHYANTNPEIKFIITPHDISENHLKEIETLFHNSIRYSVFKEEESDTTHQIASLQSHKENVLIIDNIGMLSRLYNYATVTYVGGAFTGNGLHNILEPAVYGKPVIFGPYYEKFPEASELLDEGGAFTVGNAPELEDIFNKLLYDPKLLQEASNASKTYIQKNRGTTRKIVDWIQEKRLLTN